jgi:Protein of unknown function (DUF3306)
VRDAKDFLSRWSQRKLNSEAEKAPPAEITPALPASKEAAEGTPTAAPDQEFDIASLPSLESIGADSDIRAFLQRGVPQGMTRAALRRAWSADPAIRDFVGLSENSWDFNAPNSLHGFGSLDPEEVRRLAAQLFGQSGPEGQQSREPEPAHPPHEAAESQQTPVPETQGEGVEELPQAAEATREQEEGLAISSSIDPGPVDVAAHNSRADQPDRSVAQPRRHGTALPK